MFRPSSARGPALLLAFLALLLLGALPAPAAQARAQDGATIAIQLEPPILDPTALAAAPISEVVYGNVFEGLVRLDADGTPRPLLATDWESTPDGRSYRFHLRRGVRFHDGTPFDAGVAKFALERARAKDSANPQKAKLAAVAAVVAEDSHTLRIDLARRSGSLLQTLGWPALVMVAPATAGGNAAVPVGTGPFRFEAWRRGDAIVLARNPDYWGPAPRLGQVAFTFIAEPSAAFAALMAGDVDAFPNYPSPENIPQFQADKRFAVYVGSTEGEAILAINNRKAPFDDLRVRRAIAHAIDRRALIDGAMFGYGLPIGSHFPPQNPAALDLTGRYPHDPARSRALLAEAGHPDGIDLTLALPPPPYARRGGEILAAQLAAAGFRVTVRNLEWAQWMDQVFTRREFDLTMIVHAEPADYDIYGRDDYYFGYSSPALKGLLAALDDAIEPGRRTALLQDIQRRIADDAVNGFLFQYPKLGVWDAKLKGLHVGGLVDGTIVGDAYFDAPGPEPGSAGPAPAQSGPWAPGLAVTGLAAAVAALLTFVLHRFGPAYLAGRLLSLGLTLLAATVVVFVALQVAPGDPARYMLGLDAPAEAVAALRQQLGLNAPPWQRYLDWLATLARGDFGQSYTYRVPVAGLIAERLQVSLPLAIYALVLATLAALPLGLGAAAWRGRAGDAWLSGLAQLGVAVPNFWLGILLAVVFAIELRWVSAGGFAGWQDGLGPGLKSLTLPALALAVPQAAILARVLRAALVDTLHQDYLRTARAKGLGAFRALWRHALPNALIPVLTILGMQFAFLLAGGVIIENVFFLPGLGRLVFQAIAQRDLIVVQNVVILLVFAVALTTFLVDLAYVAVDPRLKERRQP